MSVSGQTCHQSTSHAESYYVNPHESSAKLSHDIEFEECDEKPEQMYESIWKIWGVMQTFLFLKYFHKF